jgi:hypothetical protein
LSTGKSDNFVTVSFAGSRFNGVADFSGRTFTRATDFGEVKVRQLIALSRAENGEIEEKSVERGTHTSFCKPPNFHGCKLHQDTDFDGADFNDVEGPGAARAYRTLKLAMSKHQATREEQRFFKLEMQSEYRAERCSVVSIVPPRWPLFWLYEKFADFGFSIWRPFCLLLGVMFLFGMLYLFLHSPLGSKATVWVWDGEHALELARYAISQSIPLPGLDKMTQNLEETLFRRLGPVDRALLLVLVVLHKLSALLALFLIGLGLRNLFKMK